jgi:peptidoglycan-associated lipoprotein
MVFALIILSASSAGGADMTTEDRSEQGVYLERVYFDFDSYQLTPAARETLRKQADILLKNQAITVVIKGHTDENGSEEFCLALGEKLTKAVFNYLVSQGLSPTRLSVISRGKDRPLDPGHNEAAWARNRRVEFDMKNGSISDGPLRKLQAL